MHCTLASSPSHLIAPPHYLLLVCLHVQVVWDAVRAGLGDVRDAAYLRSAARMAEAFAAAASLEAAADAIEGWRLGRPHALRLLLDALRRAGGAPLPLPKMRLLMSWGLGRRLLRGDEDRRSPAHAAAALGQAAAKVQAEVEVGEAGGLGSPTAWIPSRRHVYRFLQANHRQVDLPEALELFGGCRGVDEAYLRLQYADGFTSTARRKAFREWRDAA